MISSNAGNYDFFTQTDFYEINPWIKDYKCILGYYGALASWLDYSMIKEVSERQPEWLFVLVGIGYNVTIGKSGIDQYRDIIHIPPQPYKGLPSFLKGFFREPKVDLIGPVDVAHLDGLVA